VAERAIYLDIAEYLKGLVATSDPGDLLPSDAELCERFNVSRMTARQAVQLLVNEHLIERRRGRGTFVAKRRVPRSLGSPLSFTESMRQADDRVIVIERVRLADDVPMALERAVLSKGLADAIRANLEKESLHGAFEAAGRFPSKADAEITARLANDYELEHLELDPAAVVLCEDRTIYDQDSIPLEHTTTVYAADRYSFTSVLVPPEEPT
jgi:GntR family transcriptional regulator